MISYVLINDIPYSVNNRADTWIAEAALKDLEIEFVYIWEAPYATEREAENNNYEGARVTSRKIYG